MPTVQQQVVRQKTWAMRLVEMRKGRSLEELINEMYHDDGLTQLEVAAKLGVTDSTLSRWMVALGIPTRPTGPERKEAA